MPWQPNLEQPSRHARNPDTGSVQLRGLRVVTKMEGNSGLLEKVLELIQERWWISVMAGLQDIEYRVFQDRLTMLVGLVILMDLGRLLLCNTA